MTFNNREEKDAYVSFLHKEIACDDYNERQMQSMDLSYLNKTKLKQAESALGRWNKETSKKLKEVKAHDKLHGSLSYRLTSRARTWLTVA